MSEKPFFVLIGHPKQHTPKGPHGPWLVIVSKGVVIIYGRGAGGIPKIARTQNVPTLHNPALRFCPPSEPVHLNLVPPSRDHTYICLLRHLTIQQLTHHAKDVMKMVIP